MPDDLTSATVETYWRETRLAAHAAGSASPSRPRRPTFRLPGAALRGASRLDIETGTAGGGRARFLASICDLLGHGRVISVSDDRSPRPEHPRITYIEQVAHESNAVQQVSELTGDDPRRW